ncbi:TMV resistance protein N-like isoform X2 [Prosopis cineraria]|uniref:TMV resistance protein N-like isoform X2 n=1 Tax=Prosopis cineraria TaxID=364024 RepID=UPI00240EE914|nr:TMV resistance protein N-like isoform X2 [Prosopis cineraria]
MCVYIYMAPDERGSSSSSSSSSSSCFNHGWTYDVFVSFTGGDTRYSFTGNLCYALNQKGIHTFRDDVKLRKGESISRDLLRAIEESRIAVIVFSENYASSSWCLDELVKIIECMKEKGQLVRPVFYRVNPSDVRHQRGSYGRSMAEHEAKLKEKRLEDDRFNNWRLALKEAANLSGWHFTTGYEFEFIQKIVEEISSKLNYSSLHIADYPVGLKYRMLQVISFLSMNSRKDALMVGIHGIGGIGKTTIVKAVYNSIANQFEASCFLAEVRENSIKNGLVHLQETLFSDLLAEHNTKLGDVSHGIPILQHRLRRKKVLLVLDDVDNLKQVRSLAGSQDWFGPGSRVIITTRNKHLLTLHGIERLCEVKELNDDEALELFSWNAFKRSEPDPSYMKIAKLVVQYAKGLPLALNVIGSDLFGKTIQEWESALKKYERIPSKDIIEVLKVSYDNLDDNEKEIFLDIACFFKGNLVEDVKTTLDASRFYSEYGIAVLKDKSLLTIDETSRVKMHDLIQDLGRDIARQDSPHDPGKRRRLWHHEDVLEVLTKNIGSDIIEGIVLDMPNLEQEVKLSADAFKIMKRLRVLIVRNARVSEAPKHLPDNLRLLEWNQYPSPSLPNDFYPRTLVVLNMPHSLLAPDQPFKFENLAFMNLSNNNSITRIPDVSTVPNLTRLLANHCPNLVEIDESAGNLGKLVTLSTQNCPKLQSIPRVMRSRSLEYVNLSKCSSIQSFPNMLAKLENVKNIDTEGTAIKKFPSSITNIDGLEELVLPSCIEDLPINTDVFQNTEEINVEGCPQLSKLLEKVSMVDRTNWTPKLNRLVLKSCNLSDDDLELILSSFLKLKWLVLSKNNFVSIPECIEDLQDLLFLHVDNCRQLRHVSVLPPYLQYIDARNCTSLTPDSFDVILSQAFLDVENIDIVVSRQKIPRWFDHCRKGGSVAFWVRRKFPKIAVLLVLGGETEASCINFTCEFSLIINGLQVYQDEGTLPIDHVWLFDLRIHLTAQERLNLNEHLRKGWNHVEISCTVKNNQPRNAVVKCCGIHLYKDRMNIHDVSFKNPEDEDSDIAHKDMVNSDADIYDEENRDVVFRQVLGKFFGKGIINLMEALRSSRTRDDEDEAEEEQHMTDIVDNEFPEICEVVVKDKGKGKVACSDNPEEEQHGDFTIDSETWDLMKLESLKGESSKQGAQVSKLLLGPSTELEPSASSIQYKEPFLIGKTKLVRGSTSFAFASTNKGIPDNVSTNFKVPEVISTMTNLEAEESNIQIPQPRAIQKLETNDIEGPLISMEVFYASLEAENVTLSDREDTQINTTSYEETKHALQIVRGFVSEKFSHLLQPEQSKQMKDNLEYLLSLTPRDGISLRMRSVISQISSSFTEWCTDYHNASFKLESATAEVSKVEELKEGVEGNVREFRELEELENGMWRQLEDLEEKKRELEKKINAVKAEIADFTSAREDFAKRKREVCENGRVLKARRDDLRIRLPRLISEEEWAKIMQANIEDEWSKLGQQFIENLTFGDWARCTSCAMSLYTDNLTPCQCHLLTILAVLLLPLTITHSCYHVDRFS